MSLFLHNKKLYEGTKEDVEAYLRLASNYFYSDSKLIEVTPTPISSVEVQKLLEIERQMNVKKEELNNLLSTFHQAFDLKIQAQ